MASEPILILNPRRDLAFVERAEQLVRAGIAEPGDLQAALRRDYPNAVVRPRDLSSESVPMWYVYRDGSWTPQGG